MVKIKLMLYARLFLGRSALLILLSLVIVGCATKPVAMNTNILERPDQRIHVVAAIPPLAGKLYKGGQQGLLDIAINSALASGFSSFLGTIGPDPYENLVQTTMSFLEKQGAQVSRHQTDIYYSDLPKRSKPAKGTLKWDLSDVIESTDADYILVLNIGGYGASREYYGFIPTSYPKAVVKMEVAMIDRDHVLQWSHSNNYGTYVGSEWKQPPDYLNITSALDKTWKMIEGDLLGQLQGQPPLKLDINGNGQ